MRCKSVWQPWASLIIERHKLIETSPYPVPASIMNTRIGIASTRVMRKEQVQAIEESMFNHYYQESGLPWIDELHHGFLLGTVLVYDCEAITPALVEDLTEAEIAFGIYTQGRYAWRLRDPLKFEFPIPVRGQQGIWEWAGDAEQAQARLAAQARAQAHRSDLPSTVWSAGVPRTSAA